MKVHELKYSNTNTYLIEGSKGRLLFDTGWAGTFAAFCRAMGSLNIAVQSIDYLLISHFHPDHCGIAQQIADLGATIVVMDVQKDYVHSADGIFAKERNRDFKPVDDTKIRYISVSDSRAFLKEPGIDGEILHTPGHSDDSISLWLDTGSLFVGDLNPLYELEMHKGTLIEESWNKLLALKPATIYYGHAKTYVSDNTPDTAKNSTSAGKGSVSRIDGSELSDLVSKIMKYIDKGLSLDKIQKKTGADRVFIEDVARMYLTHPGVSVQGILDRIEIKNR